MNTKMLMVASSLALGLAGIATLFAPSELLRVVGLSTSEPLPVLIQLLGGLYFAFAITNWTAKDSMIGGIYSRPVSLGNCVHFMVGALTLAKQLLAHELSAPLLAALIVYAIFAICFGWLVFGYGGAPKLPAPEQQASRS